MKFFAKAMFLFGFFQIMLVTTTNAQDPTSGDCLGAITVCEDYYFQPNTANGEGNILNEINGAQQCPYDCLWGERNSTWYRFTIQSSGLLSFVISPVDQTDDYDWAVYNLTFNKCEDIFSHADEMAVSCNSVGSATSSAYWGDTGAENGTQDCNGPGENGSKWNVEIPVNEGETYVLYISDWSQTPPGYSLDFSASTAVIYDDVDPSLQNALYTFVSCGDSTLTFNFSEAVLCSSVSKSVFRVFGPDGEHDVNEVTGSACELGAELENTYTLKVDPPFLVNGEYTLELIAFNQVYDACNNMAEPGELTFTLNLGAPEIDSLNVDIGNATCGEENGYVTGLEIDGNGPPYFYYWIDANSDTVGYDVDLLDMPAGQYTLYVEDEGGCSGVSGPYNIVDEGGPQIDDAALQTANDTCEVNMGSITGLEISGMEPFNYTWTDQDGQVVGNDLDISNLPGGEYTLTITDENDCVSVYGPIEIQSLPAPQLDVSNVVLENTRCEEQNGSITGIDYFSPYDLSFIWTDANSDTLNENTADLFDLLPGEYYLEIIDEHACSVNAGPFEIINEGGVQIDSVNFENTSCEFQNGSITISGSTFEGMGTLEYSIDDSTTWQSNSTFENLLPGTYNIIVRDQYGCYDEYPENPVTIINQGDAFNVTADGDNPLCSGDDLQLSVLENHPNLSYDWSGPDGFSSEEKNPEIEDVQTSNAGTYNVYSVDTIYGCENSSEFEVEVVQSYVLEAGIDVSKSSIYPGEEISFTAIANHGATDIYYVWYVDGQMVQSGPDSTYVTSDITADAIVYCEIHTNYTCADPNPALSNELEITIYNIRFYLPNSFNPGSTKGNEEFRIITTAEEVPDLEFIIYDRWGQKIFESNTISKGWDGTIKGKPAPEGVYVWMVNYKVYTEDSPEGFSESKKGTVMLVR